MRKIDKSVYEVQVNGKKEIVTKYFIQEDRNHSKLIRVFVGWGINEFNTYPTLRAFKNAHGL